MSIIPNRQIDPAIDTPWAASWYGYNGTGTAIAKGTIVAVSTIQGSTYQSVVLADANAAATTYSVLGIAANQIEDGDVGRVVPWYVIDGVNTTTATAAGDPVWLSDTAGGYILVGATPTLKRQIGVVLTIHATTGKILLAPGMFSSKYEMQFAGWKLLDDIEGVWGTDDDVVSKVTAPGTAFTLLSKAVTSGTSTTMAFQSGAASGTGVSGAVTVGSGANTGTGATGTVAVGSGARTISGSSTTGSGNVAFGSGATTKGAHASAGAPSGTVSVGSGATSGTLLATTSGASGSVTVASGDTSQANTAGDGTASSSGAVTVSSGVVTADDSATGAICTASRSGTVHIASGEVIAQGVASVAQASGDVEVYSGDVSGDGSAVAASGTLVMKTGITEVSTAAGGVTAGNSGLARFGSGNTDVSAGANTGGDTGSVWVESGNALSAAGTSGASGAVNVRSGTSADGNTGAVNVYSGAPTAAGTAGTVSVYGGNASGAGVGGPVVIRGGSSAAGTAGTVGITGGAETTGTAGDVNITGGSTTGAGTGGSVVITAGTTVAGTDGTIQNKSVTTTTDGVTAGTARRIGGIAYRSIADSTEIENTNTEALFDTYYAMPANTLKAGTVIRIRWSVFVLDNNGADTLTAKLVVSVNPWAAGTDVELLSSGAIDVADNDRFQGVLELVVRSAGANTLVQGTGVSGTFSTGGGTTAPAFFVLDAVDVGASTVEHFIGVTALWSAAHADNECLLEYLTVEIVG